ncbi:MAG: thioredoxin family protein [Anaerolineales bacterium]
MNAEVWERLLITGILVGGGAVGYLLLNRLLLKRAVNHLARFGAYRPGLPTIVYFTTPTCAPCLTMQRPIIERLQTRLGRWLQVIEVDASIHPEVARAWGVISVPTTFVFDAVGRPRSVNHGVASAETLLKQLDLEDFSI